MKQFCWFLLWLIGTVLFLLATAHFTLRHLLNTPAFKTAATSFIERTTDRPAEYSRIDYRLFPFTLIVRDAALKEKDGREEFASIRTFSATVDFRNKEITSLQVDQPTVRIVKKEDGTYNVSDLLRSPPREPDASAHSVTAPSGPDQPTATSPAEPPPPPASPLAIRWVDITDARVEFIRRDAASGGDCFTLSDLNFTLRDYAPDRPLRMEGRAAIGNASGFQFTLAGPAIADYANQPGSWPATFTAELDIRDFADVRALLPSAALPFQRLRAELNIHGAIADTLDIQLKAQTADATETYPVAGDLTLTGNVSLPAAVAAHLLGGAELPTSMRLSTSSCTPPPGTIALAPFPTVALALKHAQAQATLAFPSIAYGQNRFEHGSISATLHDGTLDIPAAKCAAYNGVIEARGNAQLLACPLTYQLEYLTADRLEIGPALAANGFDAFTGISGTLHLDASASGQGVAEHAIRTLMADAQARIDNLQSVGPDSSLMDHVWRQLDHPILLQVVPRLKMKVEQAKQAAATITTSHYPAATVTLALRNGTATLTNTCLAMPHYRTEFTGTLHPFDDRLDLAAKVLVSPEETARLTGGKDRSDVLPYADGGLMIPLRVRGSLRQPRVRPDLNAMLTQMLDGESSESAGTLLDDLSPSDRRHVEKGLKLLGTFLTP
ncbi:MAG: hypothetical protein RBT03_00220 [Kiritimatiellia bacterium]|jgi:hypothetical protein|nr:hypothetical protein [Kiritimatiellia bacterium]